ncbi:MAG TPA: hypothetical protein VJ842_01620 [Pyrinomonadaceae bacterium]|nr:hypothetical protein [Pyrinomonadaceae bacterium]
MNWGEQEKLSVGFGQPHGQYSLVEINFQFHLGGEQEASETRGRRGGGLLSFVAIGY